MLECAPPFQPPCREKLGLRLSAMETQFLPFDYGNKTRLEEKLQEVLGTGNYQVVEVRLHGIVEGLSNN